MTYSIITLGGTVIESGLTNEEAEKIAAKKGAYYSVKEDDAAAESVNSPTFEEFLNAMEKPVSISAKEEDSAAVNNPRWNEVVNEGGEGYKSKNW